VHAYVRARALRAHAVRACVRACTVLVGQVLRVAPPVGQVLRVAPSAPPAAERPVQNRDLFNVCYAHHSIRAHVESA